MHMAEAGVAVIQQAVEDLEDLEAVQVLLKLLHSYAKVVEHLVKEILVGVQYQEEEVEEVVLRQWDVIVLVVVEEVVMDSFVMIGQMLL